MCKRIDQNTVFKFFHWGGVIHPPPGSRCSSQTPGSDRVNNNQEMGLIGYDIINFKGVLYLAQSKVVAIVNKENVQNI